MLIQKNVGRKLYLFLLVYMIIKTLSVLCCLLQSLDCFGLCCRHCDCIDLIVLSWCLQVYSPMYKLYHKFVLSHTNVESVSDCIVVCKQTVSFLLLFTVVQTVFVLLWTNVQSGNFFLFSQPVFYNQNRVIF